jgi:hypothetical protein
MEVDGPRCVRCDEDFRLADNPDAGWAMGVLRPLTSAVKRTLPRRLRGLHGDYLCGNCFFDLTDEDE